uniref:Calcineurin-like phosphoesterase domain-containing protein n=1 Tax=Vannella robusta TaxID=1487602 RepID=A0A7S4HW36_9EUKA|mmetsp:Transcript_16459/g.21052  ORF Transcript_16459/g.21052 Transcript_16459/m.21052 type:complete len:128 (+) Transcript_16459:336-719(+)
MLTSEALNDVECEAFFYSVEAREFGREHGGMLNMEFYIQMHEKISLEKREQIKWLDETLAAMDPKSMKIVVGHHAMESASLVHGPRPLMNVAIRPILKSYGVDLYICGHDHNLQHLHRRYEHYIILL